MVAHEEAHELHFFTNPSLVREEKGAYEPERLGWSEQGKYLIETIAELSALVFHDKISRLDNNLLLSVSYYKHFLPAFELFLDNRKNAEGLLKKLAQMNVKEASPVINLYKHFLNSPKISKDICFGVCVKTADLDRVA